MRKTLLMVGVLVALGAGTAAAQIDLAWNHCLGQTGAASNRTSACTATTGSQAMYASFHAPGSVTQLEGLEAYVDYQTSSGSLPCWWNFSTGSTRAGALSVRFVSPTDIDTGEPLVSCDSHYFLGKAGVGGGGGMIQTGADRGQLKGVVAIPAGTGVAPASGQNYGMGFSISNVGTGSGCLGCANTACLVLNRILLTQGGGNPDVNLFTAQTQQHITWQGATGLNCPLATPAQSRTWGSIKALYR